MSTCRFCAIGHVIARLDLGAQPIGNRFRTSLQEKEYRFSFSVGICDHCSLMQLLDVPPVTEIVPRVPWIQYNEPEGHLDELLDELIKKLALPSSALVLGLTSKDDTFLERFRKKGFTNVHRVDLNSDLDIANPCAGIESIPDKLDASKAEKIRKRYGEPALFIARHVFEHAQKSYVFLDAIKKVVGKGLLFLEVPDCTKSLVRKDYTTLWEEHIIYFSPDTFPQNFSLYGGKPVFSKIYEGPFEDSLIAVLSFGGEIQKRVSEPKSVAEKSRSFFESFAHQKKEIQQALGKLVKEKGKVAMLGAGHLTTAFLNYWP
jgi:hypothetical protein